MKLGFISAILDGWNFDEMIDVASANGLRLRRSCLLAKG